MAKRTKPTVEKPAELVGSVRAESRKRTAKAIGDAIATLIQKTAKVSISAVAREAGGTPGLIHNTYPDLAEKVRALAGQSTRRQRDEVREELTRERANSRGLREELATLRADFAKMASNNQRLVHELSLLQGVSTGKVISLAMRPKIIPPQQSDDANGSPN